jgi:uncharacterized membrane protein YadS
VEHLEVSVSLATATSYKIFYKVSINTIYKGIYNNVLLMLRNILRLLFSKEKHTKPLFILKFIVLIEANFTHIIPKSRNNKINILLSLLRGTVFRSGTTCPTLLSDGLTPS